MNIIVTYFEPFGGRSFNASKASALGVSLSSRKVGLPVSWNDISSRLDEVLSSHPDYLFLIGEAGKINEARLELEAHNISKGKDNYQVEKLEKKIIPNGEDTLYTSFKVSEKYVLSRDAGQYLCNCSYYLALSKAKDTKVIFIHVPAFNEDDNEMKNKTITLVNEMIASLIELNP